MIDKSNDVINKPKKYNISLALLRMYLCFLVVNAHLLNSSRSNIKNIYILKLINNNIHVPIFFIMSFYFSYKLNTFKIKKKIKERFERMLIPYFIWPFLIFALNNLFYYSFNIKLAISLNDLLIQYITGHNIVAVLWFQLNLILSSILILFIELFLNKNIIFVLFHLEIISYFFQYSNLNYCFFSKYDYYKKYPYGRFMEIIPFCITGYLLAYFNIIVYLKMFKIKTIYSLLLLLSLILKYNFIIRPNGFLYQGLFLHIKSLIIFILFAIFPLETIKNNNFINIIKIITNYTSGIYYLHIPISLYLSNFIQLIKENTFYGCIIIYIICYFISYFGIKLFGKTKLRHLFQ